MRGAIPLLCHTSTRSGAEASTGCVFMAWNLIKRKKNFTSSLYFGRLCRNNKYERYRRSDVSY
jgi:hypothetical protein